MVVALGSCAVPPEVAVFNNSGRELVLQLTPRYPWQPTSSVRLPAGTLKVFGWYRMAPPGVVLRVGGCTYGYDPPRLDRTYFEGATGYPATTSVQVDPDLTVVLLPVTARQVMPDAKDLPLQAKYGFPLKPVSTSCEAARP